MTHERLDHRPIDAPPQRQIVYGWYYRLDAPEIGYPDGYFTLYANGLLKCSGLSGEAWPHSRHPGATPDEVAAWLWDQGYELEG
jgi:hypothetical protein